jgi:transposase
MLAEIEAMVGQRLFERHPKGMVPTSIAEVLIRHATSLLRGLAATASEVGAFSSGKTGTVRVGSVTGAAVAYVVPAIQSLKQDANGAEVYVDVGPSDALMERLLNGDYDFILSRIPPRIWMRDSLKSSKVELIPSGVKADSRGDFQSVKSLNLWRHVWEDVAMGAAIGLRADFDGAALRRLARKTANANQSRRLLALAEIYDGGSRSDSARIGGVGLQIVRDWVVRFNARGPDGLIDGKAPGKRPKLNGAQRQALVAIVESGPIPAIHGVVRWRLIDLAQWLYAEFKVSLDETTVGRELKKLGYVKLTARPRHHAQDTEALEAFKKGALQPNWKKFAHASRTALR